MTDVTYDIQAQADDSEIETIIDGFKEMVAVMKRLEDETKDQGKAAAQSAEALEDMAKGAKGLGLALKAIPLLAVLGGLQQIFDMTVGMIGATQEWALEIDNLSKRWAIGLEDATALMTSFTLAGGEIGELETALDSFTGMLFESVEYEKESAKELSAINQERAEVIQGITEAEEEHAARVAQLRAEMAAIDSSAVTQRMAERDEELAQLEADHNRTIDELQAREQQTTDQMEREWAERAKAYKKSFLDAKDDFENASRRAGNFREFMEAADQFKKRRGQLNEDMSSERQKRVSENERRIADTQAAIEREKELFNERSEAIQTKAAEDVAKIEAQNQRAIANLQARIDRENEAYEDGRAAADERLASLAAREAEVAAEATGVVSVLDELGVALRDAEGNIRPVDDLFWDIHRALNEMPESARKAAIINELGFDDIAQEMSHMVGETEALARAQELGLVPTRDSIAAIHEQNRLLADGQLQLMGYTSQLFEALGGQEGLNTGISTGIEWFKLAVGWIGQLWEWLSKLKERLIEGYEAWAALEDRISNMATGAVGDLVSAVTDNSVTRFASGLFGGGDATRTVANTTVNGGGTTINVQGSVVDSQGLFEMFGNMFRSEDQNTLNLGGT